MQADECRKQFNDRTAAYWVSIPHLMAEIENVDER